MALSTIERISPFSPDFTWDEYTNELFFISDDYGFLTIDQMINELHSFKMTNFNDHVSCSMHVDDFVDFLYDSNDDSF